MPMNDTKILVIMDGSINNLLIFQVKNENIAKKKKKKKKKKK